MRYCDRAFGRLAARHQQPPRHSRGFHGRKANPRCADRRHSNALVLRDLSSTAIPSCSLYREPCSSVAGPSRPTRVVRGGRSRPPSMEWCRWSRADRSSRFYGEGSTDLRRASHGWPVVRRAARRARPKLCSESGSIDEHCQVKVRSPRAPASCEHRDLAAPPDSTKLDLRLLPTSSPSVRRLEAPGS